jgi:hypothetical protein
LGFKQPINQSTNQPINQSKMTTIYQRIHLLPQYVQDTIWSFNVEDHPKSTRNISDEFYRNQHLYCMKCMNDIYIKDLVDKNYLSSFSAEYFFKRNGHCDSYGLICENDCQGNYRRRLWDRFDDIKYHRMNYYAYWYRRMDIDNQDQDY